ncbi:SMI1/KNR4 family protein [Promicromonospora panici]|uniref:SMI1/KNR4 family protein n=1 Tax=Promicromonospora panici TaxID=2219658 RepID=UPI00101C96A4|nr:SMI1/KNR4 family protein [Promicromonospora panici]
MSLEDLVDAGGLTPREEPFDWERAESQLQIPIPEDYRRLVDAGGSGLWFDYIRVFAPDERYLSRNLLDSNGVFEDLLILWEDDPEFRPADLPEGDDARLIAWANTANGEMLFWRTEPGADPDAYPIYVENADGEEWERFDMSTTDYLTGLLRGEVSSEFFSSTFLRTDQVFQPYPDL